MDELNKLLTSSWGAEKWISEGWSKISADEKAIINARMDDLFKDGLPFELKHDKLFYIYTFSLLAQLEVLAIQVPLKFENKISSLTLKKCMRKQLLDEIFHGLVFTKIVYLLCSPYVQPPAYNESVEALCNFIREESCPKVGIVLLNLIGEGWIEEIFSSLYKQQVAPKVFAIIIEDEHRHVGEADLYSDIGLPDMTIVRNKLDYLETQLVSIFSQYKYAISVSSLLSIQGTIDFIQAIDQKHRTQLKKLGLTPGKMWESFLTVGQEFFPHIHNYSESIQAVEMSPTRQLFMTQWGNPNDPTMVGEFDVNINCLDFFNKKYPAQTLTILMLQTISQCIHDNELFRRFLYHKELYKSQQAYVAIVVQLPECGDHLGNIVFENCHNFSLPELINRIKHVIKIMTFCYKKREQLEKIYPHLKSITSEMLYDFNFGTYAYPMPGNSMVTLSNIGTCGYLRAKSPLRSTESMKFTLLEVTRKPVWNKITCQFEPQDVLPVSVSADHRILDGNLPIPKLINNLFQQKFKQMFEKKSNKNMFWLNDLNDLEQFLAYNAVFDQLPHYSVEIVYKTLLMLQSMWPDFMKIEDFFNQQVKIFKKEHA
jgi:hypothetical protein